MNHPEKSHMRLWYFFALWMLMLPPALVASGCSRDLEVLQPTRRADSPSLDYENLSAVLKAGVGQAGLLDPKALGESSDALEAQLAMFAITGPTASPGLFCTGQPSTPSEKIADDELAYWYNARTAWAIRLAMDQSSPDRQDTAAINSRRFRLDGRVMTLEQIDRILAGDGDWRVLLASPGTCPCRAKIPDKPFASAGVRGQLAGRINELLADDERVRINIARRRLEVPQVVWDSRNRIIDEHVRSYGSVNPTLITALLPHAAGKAKRKLQDATGYEVVPIRKCPGTLPKIDD